MSLQSTLQDMNADSPTPALPAAGDDLAERFEARTYREAGARLRYRLLRPLDFRPAAKARPQEDSHATTLPGSSRGEGRIGHSRSHSSAVPGYPLILFLHGAGERGDDNQLQLLHGVKQFALDQIRAQYPCFVVAPQCPLEQQWVDTAWSAAAHTMPSEPAPPLRLALNLLAELEHEFPINARRVYITGLSMGGFGVWDALQRYPRRFAAAVPVCGGGDLAQAERVTQVPVWAFHGAQDDVVLPGRSRDMIAAVRQAGGEPRYTEYSQTGHDAWSETYRNPELYAWLFAQAWK